MFDFTLMQLVRDIIIICASLGCVLLLGLFGIVAHYSLHQKKVPFLSLFTTQKLLSAAVVGTATCLGYFAHGWFTSPNMFFVSVIILLITALTFLISNEARIYGRGLGAYIKAELRRPFFGYGVLVVGLFFATYGCRLVVVKMTLALCYALVIARLFLRSDPR